MDIECAQPIAIRNGVSGRLVRCRQCPPCLRASQRYWAAAAAHQIRQAHETGCRSWMGTCTFKPEHRSAFEMKAAETCRTQQRRWESLDATSRFDLLRCDALAEVQRYCKRLRKRGPALKYLAVFEPDQAAWPHMHCFVHELDPGRQILKRELDAAWGLGFTNFSMLAPAADGSVPFGAISYVTKAIARHPQGRVCASADYVPERRLPKMGRPHQQRLLFVR